jgi:hypothetical protein
MRKFLLVATVVCSFVLSVYSASTPFPYNSDLVGAQVKCITIVDADKGAMLYVETTGGLLGGTGSAYGLCAWVIDRSRVGSLAYDQFLALVMSASASGNKVTIGSSSIDSPSFYGDSVYRGYVRYITLLGKGF